MNFIGRIVGQYRIVEPIGQGGMASVYKAYQPALERFVAVKVLPTRHAIANGFSERFVREARAIAQLNHPNILPILDFGQEDDFSYIVTKLVTGGTLKDRLGRAMELSRAARIIEQIAAALDHAHERSILHRDVKPSNVLLDDGDWVQLADFGLAKMLAGDEGLTASGVGIGTPAYMSPEQGQGLRVDHRTDIYSLGVVLYEMVTGRLPYRAETPMAIIFKHIYEPLTLPRLVRPEIPPLVEAVVLKAMGKKPEDRYDSASGMAQALREAVVISETGAGAVLKPLTAPVDDASSQPTLSLEEGAAEAARPLPQTAPAERTPVPEVTPPPEPPSPPEVKDFVGRKTELAYFSEKLKALNLAVITGMAGVGKTMLAAKLVQQTGDPDKTFWHSFHESEGVASVIWKLAGFLYWRGQPDLWCMLQSTQQNGGQPPPSEVLLDYLIQMTRGQGYLLCLDDLDLVDDDPLLAQLTERLHQVVLAGELSLVVASRRVPEFVPTGQFEPLTGLSADDTRALLAVRGLSLSDKFLDDLYTQTEGNAQMLTLAIEALKRTQNPRRVISHLAETADIERFLMSEVDAGLTQAEREVMSAISTLLGYPAARDAIEAVLDGGSVRRILGDLTRRHLLVVTAREWAREYTQHITVRAFYYDLLGRRERQEMHHRAGAFYEADEPDALKAAMHYERAEEHERAARLATEDVWGFINQGQARALHQLLERFTAGQLDTQLWAAVNITRGYVCSFLREGKTAQDSFQEALSSLAMLPDTSVVHELRARACRGMGELLEYEAPREALEWLRRGLEDVSGINPEEESALHVRIGSALIAAADYGAAKSALEIGLEMLPGGTNPLRASALANLGTIHGTQGDLERANAYTLQGLQISQQLNNYYQMLVMQSNLGVFKEIAGNWDAAATDYRQALALAEQLGSIAQQARIENSLGILHTKQGDDEAAVDRLSSCLRLAREGKMLELEIAGQASMADLHLRKGEPEAAKPLLAEAERLALEMGAKDQLPEIYRGWARVQLANELPEAALGNAERAVSLARELGLNLEEGIGLRVLGQILIARNQAEPGVDALKQSLSLLTDDPYEAARTKVEWGRYLVANTEVDYGRTLLQEARATFEELAAKRDLATVDEILEMNT